MVRISNKVQCRLNINQANQELNELRQDLKIAEEEYDSVTTRLYELESMSKDL